MWILVDSYGEPVARLRFSSREEAVNHAFSIGRPDWKVRKYSNPLNNQ